MTPYDHIESELKDSASLEDSVKVLELLLSGGFAIWTDGTLYNIKQLVARVNGLKVEIFSREHPPPHFHISGGGIDATFSLADCAHLEGEIPGRERRLVEWWYERSRTQLIQEWNKTRPDNCPVGPVVQ
jgi:hypothetical protein